MKVSVIMPTYNRLELMKRAIKSFFDQDYENSELIILENGCTDGTKEYLKSISNPRIKVIHNKVNKILGSLNTLWNAADGHLICQLHDDDEFTKFSLSRRVDRFKIDKFLEVCYGGWINQNLNRDVLGIFKGQGSNPSRILANEYINFTTLMWKNDLKNKFMFDEDLFYYVDWHFKIRCAMECTMTAIEQPVMMYTIHNGQETTRCRIEGKNAIEEALMRKKIKEVYGGLFL